MDRLPNPKMYKNAQKDVNSEQACKSKNGGNISTVSMQAISRRKSHGNTMNQDEKEFF